MLTSKDESILTLTKLRKIGIKYLKTGKKYHNLRCHKYTVVFMCFIIKFALT